MPRHVSTTITLDRGEAEFEVEVSGSYYPGTSATDDPSEIIDVVATCPHCNQPIDLTEAELLRAEEALFESAYEDIESDREDAAEYRAERLREDG